MDKNKDVKIYDAFWLKEFKKYPNQKVLLMLSGGKDSTCCLAILKKNNIEVSSIFFKHKWSWENALKEAKRAAKFFSSSLKVIDITNEFCKVVSSYDKGRPCRVCKPIMYKKTMNYAKEHGFGWICVGDNASDTIVERIKNFEEKKSNTNIIFSDYLDSIEQGVPVKEGLKIIRPIIHIKADKVEKILKNEFGYAVNKNHETGDKYLGYWREGCPIQYTDPGLKHKKESLDLIFNLNKIATDFAKKRNIRASVHWPSGNIVTIPAGCEEELRELIESKGFKMVEEKTMHKRPFLDHYIIECFGIKSYLLNPLNHFEPLAQRFAERIKVRVLQSFYHQFAPYGITYLQVLSESHIAYHSWPQNNYLIIDLLSCVPLKFKEKIEDILFEIFKTRDIEIHKIEYDKINK